jgi:hypothetical protein
MDVVKYESDEVDEEKNMYNKIENEAELIIKSFIPEEYLEERNNPNIVCDVNYRNFENLFIDSINNDYQTTAERIVDNALGINQSNPVSYKDSEIGSHAIRVLKQRAENGQNEGRYLS